MLSLLVVGLSAVGADAKGFSRQGYTPSSSKYPDCWDKCGKKGGDCRFCDDALTTTQHACCMPGWNDPSECDRAMFASDAPNSHHCVRLAEEENRWYYVRGKTWLGLTMLEDTAMDVPECKRKCENNPKCRAINYGIRNGAMYKCQLLAAEIDKMRFVGGMPGNMNNNGNWGAYFRLPGKVQGQSDTDMNKLCGDSGRCGRMVLENEPRVSGKIGYRAIAMAGAGAIVVTGVWGVAGRRSAKADEEEIDM